jgi:hypothetical protein
VKDNLVLCDILSPKFKVNSKPKRLRVVSGRLIPGETISLQADTYGAPKKRHRLWARCLATGTLLVEPLRE